MTDEKRSPVESVIIPVGGYGTRLGEVTKAVPKSLLPVGDKPLIMHAIDEAIESGARNILVPCRPDDVGLFYKQLYGNKNRDLIIAQNGREHLLDDDNKSSTTTVDVIPIFNPDGPASTIAQVASESGLETFGVILPDDLLLDDTPALKQLADDYSIHGVTTIGARRACLKTESTNNVTFVKTGNLEDGTKRITSIQVKPEGESPVSKDATCGRYIFDEDVLSKAVKDLEGTGLKEISMSAVVGHLAEAECVAVTQLGKARFFDCGDQIGYHKAQAAFIDPQILMEAFADATEAQVVMQLKVSAEHNLIEPEMP